MRSCADVLRQSAARPHRAPRSLPGRTTFLARGRVNCSVEWCLAALPNWLGTNIASIHLNLLTGESLARAILRIIANDDAPPAEKLIDG
jgi:hypothetical protein